MVEATKRTSRVQQRNWCEGDQLLEKPAAPMQSAIRNCADSESAQTEWSSLEGQQTWSEDAIDGKEVHIRRESVEVMSCFCKELFVSMV